jgi:prepilin-type N-terminal cleavage/methylation domain-containing protein
MIHHSARQPRPAFTLVELLVTMALILFIMVILSSAFVAGLDAFRQLKGIGDMEERLRTTALILRRDLGDDHFEGKRRLSDANFWNLGTPLQGFFRIVQAQDPRFPPATGPQSYPEGVDLDGNPAYRATTHSLHFSVKLRGNRPEDFFTASVPNGSPLVPYVSFNPPNPPTPNPNFVSTNFFAQAPDGSYLEYPALANSATANYNSPWAEVTYTLVPNGSFAGTTPLFALYRSQAVVVPDNRNLNWPNPARPGILPVPVAQFGNYGDISCERNGQTIYFNNPTDLANGKRGFPLDLTQPSTWPQPPWPGATLLLTDVISFDVRILKRQANGALGSDFEDLFTTNPLPTPPWIFDTYIRPGQPPPSYTMSAIQIGLRVWDLKTEQARQITIMQDM